MNEVAYTYIFFLRSWSHFHVYRTFTRAHSSTFGQKLQWLFWITFSHYHFKHKLRGQESVKNDCAFNIIRLNSLRSFFLLFLLLSRHSIFFCIFAFFFVHTKWNCVLDEERHCKIALIPSYIPDWWVHLFIAFFAQIAQISNSIYLRYCTIVYWHYCSVLRKWYIYVFFPFALIKSMNMKWFSSARYEQFLIWKMEQVLFGQCKSFWCNFRW